MKNILILLFSLILITGCSSHTEPSKSKRQSAPVSSLESAESADVIHKKAEQDTISKPEEINKTLQQEPLVPINTEEDDMPRLD